MTTSRQQDQGAGSQQGGQAGNQSGAKGGAEQRSEGLLPAGKDDDGRFDVAEEVNLDQQSDAIHQVGGAPGGKAADAVAESLKPGGKA